jgi:hypothetical protein
MAIDNPFSITYGARQVGGTSDTYQLHGPYIIDKSFETIRVGFTVIVVASSYATLQSLSDDLEQDFRQRDKDLVIDLDGATWTYTFGTDILNTVATIVKSGDPETDQGFSRAYACTVEGSLPADDNDGLQEIQVNTNYESGRQKLVTMQGVYTAINGTTALAQYQADFPNEAQTILTALDATATFELVDEVHTQDRNDHVLSFTQQYVQILAAQSQAALDDLSIRDHRITFTDLSQHPGDSAENIHRLRRVVGSYECAIDIEQTTDLQSVYLNTVRPHVIALFQQEFSPNVFAIEEQRTGYDETSKRMSVTLQLIYQTSDSQAVVEISESVAFRESRAIDYTPTHDGGELSMYADPGWAVVERVASRTVITVGDSAPRRRIGLSDRRVASSGWNVVQNTSQVTNQWVGDPTFDQIKLSILSETVVDRLSEKPGVQGIGFSQFGPRPKPQQGPTLLGR